MSKELTLVEMFEVFCEFCVEEVNTLRHKNIKEDYFYNEKYKVFMTDRKTGKGGYIADIEKALKEHTKIKELFEKFGIEDVYNLEVRLINYELATNKNKAFEIIKEKRVDVCYFMNCKTLEEYNDDVLASYAYDKVDAEQRMLTQEEFGLLQEELLWD